MVVEVMTMTKLINVRFFKGTYGNCVQSTDRQFPASSNGSPVSSKKSLTKSLKSRMNRFYPGVVFIFNFAK